MRCIPAFLLLLFALLTAHLKSFSQHYNTDSLQKVLQTAKEDTLKIKNLVTLDRYLLLEARYAKSDSVAGVLKQLAEKLSDTAGITAYYKICGTASYARGSYLDALKNYTEALKLDEKRGRKTDIASTCANIGSIYYSQGNYPQALENYLRALKLDEETGNMQGINNAYTNIGIVYEAQADYPEALKYYNLALEEYEKSGDKAGVANLYGNLGSVYQEQGNFEGALEAQKKSLELYTQQGYNRGMGIAYVNMGDAYEAKKDYERALASYTEALKILEGVGHKRGMGYSFVGLGSVNLRLKKYPVAKAFLDSALTLARQIGSKELIKDACNYRTELDSATGDYKAAFNDYKGFVSYRDSLKNEDAVRKLVSEQMQYNFDKKQAVEKAEQDKKDVLIAANAKRQKTILAFVLVVMALLGGIVLIIFRALRITRNQKALIEKQKDEVEKKNIIIEEKNKNIVDSINYAKRIQEAILPDKEAMYRIFPDSFSLFLPKDVVSGDFYWFTEKDGKRIIAAIDCTGHGVPGAFMSMVSSAFLEEIINLRGVTGPAAILSELRNRVIKALKQTGTIGETGDGMDIALLAFDDANKTVEYAGANNPLWVFTPKGGQYQFREYNADKRSIGYFMGKGLPFSQHTIQLNKGDAFYIFTDGYADQFGGPKGKKFKYKQLQELLLANAGKSMDEQKKILEVSLNEWKGSLEQVDDILIIGVKIS